MAYVKFAFKTVHNVLHVLETRVPSKHGSLIQYWPIAGPASQMVAQQWANIGSTILDQHIVFSRWFSYSYYIIGGTLHAMVNCWHSKQARLLITAVLALSTLHNFYRQDWYYLPSCQKTKSFFSLTVKNNRISNIFSYKSVAYRFYL